MKEATFFVILAGLMFWLGMTLLDLQEAKEEARLATKDSIEAWKEIQILRASMAHGVPVRF